MTNRFANLEACCDGFISIETLERFQRAMREYEHLMEQGRALLAPVVTPGGSVECPHCHWGFAPSVIDQHIREKH